MKRLVPFLLILGVYTYLTCQITDMIGYELDKGTFAWAMGTAAFTGFTWFLMNDWWNVMGKPGKPQTVTISTKETPNQVMRAALWAGLKFFVILAMVAFLVWLLGFGGLGAAGL